MPSPSERIAHLEARLSEERKRCAILTARLTLLQCDLSPDVPEWAHQLAPGPAALLEALLRAYPRVLNRWQLDEMVPRFDHAKERTDKVVDVYVHTVRQALGKDVIENVWGRGWRCSAEFQKRWGNPSQAVMR